MWAKPEMLHGLPSVLRATEQNDVRACGCAHSQLVECEAFSSDLLNACASRCGEAQGAYRQLWYLIQPVVVRHRAHDRPDLSLMCFDGVLVWGYGDDFGETDGGAVDAGGYEAAEDYTVEIRVGTTLEEFVTVRSVNPGFCGNSWEFADVQLY